MDHDLPSSSHAAAVEEARVRAQKQSGQRKGTGIIQSGDPEGDSGGQQQANQPIFTDWASI